MFRDMFCKVTWKNFWGIDSLNGVYRVLYICQNPRNLILLIGALYLSFFSTQLLWKKNVDKSTHWKIFFQIYYYFLAKIYFLLYCLYFSLLFTVTSVLSLILRRNKDIAKCFSIMSKLLSLYMRNSTNCCDQERSMLMYIWIYLLDINEIWNQGSLHFLPHLIQRYKWSQTM